MNTATYVYLFLVNVMGEIPFLHVDGNLIFKTPYGEIKFTQNVNPSVPLAVYDFMDSDSLTTSHLYLTYTT